MLVTLWPPRGTFQRTRNRDVGCGALANCGHGGNSPEGHPLRRTKFRPRWADACKTAGVSGLHFHDLRGSGATWAAIAGATLPELMHRLGHRTHTAALRYQHSTSERHREVADRLGALLRPGEIAQEPVADIVDIKAQNGPVESHYST
jgi:Phage integrase family